MFALANQEFLRLDWMIFPVSNTRIIKDDKGISYHTIENNSGVKAICVLTAVTNCLQKGQTGKKKQFIFTQEIGFRLSTTVVDIHFGDMKTQNFLFYTIFLLFAFYLNGFLQEDTTYETEGTNSDEGELLASTSIILW